MTRPIANPGLRELCEQHGATVNGIACWAGVARGSVHAWVRGRPSPSLETALAGFFGCSVADLRRRVGLSAVGPAKEGLPPPPSQSPSTGEACLAQNPNPRSP